MLSRRNFLAGAIAGSGSIAAPRAFAAVVSDRPPALFSRALAALERHGQLIRARDFVGIVDFGVASHRSRFHLVDVAGGRTTSFLVAHGRGSDPANVGWVQRFSNRPGSDASSDGSYVTGETYFGRHGRSRHLEGLDPENDQAARRAIVIHSAAYVSQVLADAQGKIGRSQGCFAVSETDLSTLLARLGPGRLLFAAK
jgi:L,D-transpeptidase catalytic domain